MALIVLAAVSVGALSPFILLKFGFDPSTAPGPLVTSIADAVGVLIYFSIAGAVLDL